jgi:hypothetical protein
MHLTKRTVLALASLAIVAGCSGGSGNGRSPTIVAGNVVSASAGLASRSVIRRLWQLAAASWRSEAVAQVPGITVAIAGSSTAGTTDDLGFFRLEGNQFGPVVIQFTGNGANAGLPVTLPFGGELDLVNVALSGSEITVGEQRIHFDGPITGIDCQANLLQVLSGEQVPFRVRLQPGTSIVDETGAPLSCADLFTGRGADVQGNVNSLGDVLAVALVVNPAASVTQTPQAFEGSIAALDCPTDLRLASASGNLQVNISSSTEIRDTGGQSLRCRQLFVGDDVRVEGIETGFGVDASEIDRLAPTPTPTPTPR